MIIVRVKSSFSNEFIWWIMYQTVEYSNEWAQHMESSSRKDQIFAASVVNTYGELLQNRSFLNEHLIFCSVFEIQFL